RSRGLHDRPEQHDPAAGPVRPKKPSTSHRWESADCGGCACETQDRLAHRIPDQPGAGDCGDDRHEPDPGHALEPADFARELVERQMAADQPRLIAISGDLSIDEGVGSAADSDDMAM